MHSLTAGVCFGHLVFWNFQHSKQVKTLLFAAPGRVSLPYWRLLQGFNAKQFTGKKFRHVYAEVGLCQIISLVSMRQVFIRKESLYG